MGLFSLSPKIKFRNTRRLFQIKHCERKSTIAVGDRGRKANKGSTELASQCDDQCWQLFKVLAYFFFFFFQIVQLFGFRRQKIHMCKARDGERERKGWRKRFQGEGRWVLAKNGQGSSPETWRKGERERGGRVAGRGMREEVGIEREEVVTGFCSRNVFRTVLLLLRLTRFWEGERWRGNEWTLQRGKLWGTGAWA